MKKKKSKEDARDLRLLREAKRKNAGRKGVSLEQFERELALTAK